MEAELSRSRLVIRWILGIAAGAMVLTIPLLYYRANYEHSRRLRLVADRDVTLPGGQKVHHIVYRSGQLTAAGLRDACRQHKIKTVINLQEEARDPLIPEASFRKPSLRQSDVLADMNVNYIALDGGVFDHPEHDPQAHPAVIDRFLAILRDPSNHPVLFHCKAGLHRTGLMTAVYRMEFEHATPLEVMEELKANGFGTFAATEGNAYIDRFILQFRPSHRTTTTALREGRP